MQDVESHTVVFPRTIFSQRAVDDPLVGTFLICWLYEEGMHGRALAKFLDCAGHPVVPHRSGRTTLMDHVDRTLTTLLAAVWRDFLALHMAWGAIHECTTIHAYQRLMLGLMQRFYVPVGTKHQPDDLARWVSGWLFDGLDGRDAAVRVDKTISKLPGFSGARFLGNWLERNVYA